ncbi:hypothetical protein HPB49_006709 [Dermacentor silvarum]|uniref:Uncharacterized protein n=1 Tax=Dermacentor silvarum TaxID=543639 RepID=A0ACB8DWR7_DERSI|nr:hypothetical protein HPB49_006709 [Dermacentor silvarum]
MTSSNLPELYAALTMYQQRDAPGDAMEAAASQHCPNEDMLATPQTTANKCDSRSSKTVKLVDTKEYEASVPVDVELEASIIAEGEAVEKESERKSPTESAVVDIVRRLEEVLQEKGACQEGDLMGALNLSQHDAEVAKLKARLKTLRESPANEEQELLVMIDELLQTPPPDPTPRAAEVKNPIAKKENPTVTNEEDAQVSPRPPQSRPLLPERNPLPLPRHEDKARSLAVDLRPRPQPISEKELSGSSTPPPAPDFSELPGSKEKVAASCSDMDSMRPSQKEVPTKSKVAQQISQIVRMGNTEGGTNWAILLVSPIMKRAQLLESSSEVIFVDSMASCDTTRSTVMLVLCP